MNLCCQQLSTIHLEARQRPGDHRKQPPNCKLLLVCLLLCFPSQNVVNYYGEHADRKVIVDCELFHPRASRTDPLVAKVDVVITTYERLVADKSLFEVSTLVFGVHQCVMMCWVSGVSGCLQALLMRFRADFAKI